jgi:hypothetical protein
MGEEPQEYRRTPASHRQAATSRQILASWIRRGLLTSRRTRRRCRRTTSAAPSRPETANHSRAPRSRLHGASGRRAGLGPANGQAPEHRRRRRAGTTKATRPSPWTPQDEPP